MIMLKSMVKQDRPHMTQNKEHALCMLDNYGYKHILRISNTYGFFHNNG